MTTPTQDAEHRDTRKFRQLIPGGYSSLFKHISPTAFDVVDWKRAILCAGSLSRRVLLRSGVRALSSQLTDHLPKSMDIGSAKSGQSPAKCVNVDFQQRVAQGQATLELYFAQIANAAQLNGKIFLDLRSDSFRWKEETRVEFLPNGLWHQFDVSFLNSIAQLYSLFYLSTCEDFRSSKELDAILRSLNLLPENASQESRNHLVGLIERHFGSGRDRPMTFHLADFVASFDALFKSLKDQKVTLSHDFLFLGVVLVTLYLHLEKLAVPLDVAQAWKNAQNLK